MYVIYVYNYNTTRLLGLPFLPASKEGIFGLRNVLDLGRLFRHSHRGQGIGHLLLERGGANLLPAT